MIAKIIEYSARNKFIVFLLVFFLAAWGYWAMTNTPLDALPDLSDTQVIIYTEWAGRSPDLVEDQITYPITSTLLAAPKVQAVRGFSFLGSSFIYVIFEEGTDIYWAQKPGPRIPAGGEGQDPGRRQSRSRPRCHERRLGLFLCAGR